MRGNSVRKPILYAGALVVVLGAAALIGYFALGFDPLGAVGLRTRVHLLCATTSAGAQGDVVESVAVLTVDGGRAGVLFVPADLWVKTPGGVSGKLGDVAVREGWPSACRSLAPLLGVSLNRYVVLDQAGLSAFLALFPSVTVSVDDPVTAQDAKALGGATLRIDPGNRTLTPREMLAFLRGSSRSSRAERGRRAFDALLKAARSAESGDPIGQGVEGVVSAATTNVQGADAAALWKRVLAAAETETAVLPTREVPQGGAVVRVPAVAEGGGLVASLVGGAPALTPADVTVAVFNGSGVRLSASRGAEYLRARGFRVSTTANAESFAYATSYVVVLTDEAKAWMLRQTLPSEATVVSRDEFAEHYEALRSQVPTGTDVVLVVGAGMEFAE